MAETQLDLASYLAELEAEQAKRAIVIADIRRRLELGPGEDATSVASLPGGNPSPSRPGRIRTDEFFRMSIPEAIKKYLNIMKQPQGPKAIAQGLKDGGLLTSAKHFYANVFTALKRLREADQVVNTSNGWALSEWYPNRPKGTDDKGKKGKGRKKAGRTPRAAKDETGSAPKSAYRAFLTEAMKGGKTMAQAAEEWRKQQSTGEATAKLTVA